MHHIAFPMPPHRDRKDSEGNLRHKLKHRHKCSLQWWRQLDIEHMTSSYQTETGGVRISSPSPLLHRPIGTLPTGIQLLYNICTWPRDQCDDTLNSKAHKYTHAHHTQAHTHTHTTLTFSGKDTKKSRYFFCLFNSTAWHWSTIIMLYQHIQ